MVINHIVEIYSHDKDSPHSDFWSWHKWWHHGSNWSKQNQFSLWCANEKSLTCWWQIFALAQSHDICVFACLCIQNMYVIQETLGGEKSYQPHRHQLHQSPSHHDQWLSPWLLLLLLGRPPNIHIFPVPSMTALCPNRPAGLSPLVAGDVHLGGVACGRLKAIMSGCCGKVCCWSQIHDQEDHQRNSDDTHTPLFPFLAKKHVAKSSCPPGCLSNTHSAGSLKCQGLASRRTGAEFPSEPQCHTKSKNKYGVKAGWGLHEEKGRVMCHVSRCDEDCQKQGGLLSWTLLSKGQERKAGAKTTKDNSLGKYSWERAGKKPTQRDSSTNTNYFGK